MKLSTTLREGKMDVRRRYADLGIDVDAAFKALRKVSLSLHCWQGDDVGGFEKSNAELEGGGIQTTGNYPGKARTAAELQRDMEAAYALIPGNHRLNLHAIYGEFGRRHVDRNEIDPEHFKGWAEWSRNRGVPVDFNATCFSHPLACDGFTLSSKDPKKRDFWIEHVKRCRGITDFFAANQEGESVHNTWIPDGFKDKQADLYGHRRILMDALDEIFSVKYPEERVKDAVESKLFGIGSESAVIGSHEFYLGYAITRGKMLCLDMGHFHPTESVADKISAILQFQDAFLLHVSRPVRWDSDHVAILNDELRDLANELVRCGALGKSRLGLDFFDASINRIGAWALGARATLKALLLALLEPREAMLRYEEAGNNFARLALLEETKTMPFGLLWDEYCESAGVPTDRELIDTVMQYERDVLANRD